jgi:hypothetical protein
MNTSSSTFGGDQGRYDLVSSLYGPGTTACWYLSALTCLVSWTIHPKKRRSGSIDSDFIAVLTFPAVAAGHLISQLHQYPALKVELLSTNDPNLLRQVAAIEASLSITEASLIVFIMLFLIATSRRCVKRAIAIAIVGLFCFDAEVFMFFVTWRTGQAQHNLSRPFLVNFGTILIGTIALLSVLKFLSFVLLGMFFARRRPKISRPEIPEPSRSFSNHRNRAIEVEIERGQMLWNVEQPDPWENDQHLELLTSFGIVVLPLSAVATSVPALSDALSASGTSVWTWIIAAGCRLTRALFPRTNASIKDLDQAVALLAGMTILGFGLYGIADAHHQQWLKMVKSREERRAIALARIRREVEQRHLQFLENTIPLPSPSIA